MGPPQFHPPDSSVLKDKVVVLTGGADGIGAATVRLLHAAGAHVFFGDILDSQAIELERELSTDSSPATVKFVHCDVTHYKNNLALFDTAYQAFGRVDHAIANAGLGEQGNIFDPELTLESVQQEPGRELSVIDVNLKGPLYFTRIASVYLRQGSRNNGDKSLTLTSSVGGFRADPGLWAYVPSKHGVLGLMRVVKDKFLAEPYKVRTNAICPWMTQTSLASGISGQWDEAKLPKNTPEDVAKVIVGVLADRNQNGGAIYIEGGRAWDVDRSMWDNQAQWLGERQAADLDRGTEVLGSGAGWVTVNQN